MRYQYHQPAPAAFRAPEFYENGPVVTVISRDRSITVFRDGTARLAVGEDKVYRTPVEFALGFSDGVLPADEYGEVTWHNNGWFDLYEDIDGEWVHLDAIEYNLDDAMDAAESRALGAL
jgi:hypothetical protein